MPLNHMRNFLAALTRTNPFVKTVGHRFFQNVVQPVLEGVKPTAINLQDVDDISSPNLSLIELFSSKDSSRITDIEDNPFATTASLNHVEEEADSVEEGTDSVEEGTDSVEEKADSVEESTDSVEEETNSVEEETNSVEEDTDSVVLIPDGSKAAPTVAAKLTKWQAKAFRAQDEEEEEEEESR